MEKYLNSNFDRATKPDIITLQKYLSDLGYKKTNGTPLNQDGNLDNETRKALKQVKKDLVDFKGLTVVTASEYNTLLNKKTESCYDSIAKNTKNSYKAQEELFFIKTYIVPAYKISGDNWDKILMLKYRNESGIFIDEDYIYDNLNIKYTKSENSVFLGENSLGQVRCTDDERIKRYHNFEKLPVPSKPKIIPKIKTENKPTAIEIKKPANDDTTKIPIVTLIDEYEQESPEKICEDIKIDWNNFKEFVNGLKIDGTTPEEVTAIRNEVTKYNIRHPKNPIKTTTIVDGKATTYKFRMTPCK